MRLYVLFMVLGCAAVLAVDVVKMGVWYKSVETRLARLYVCKINIYSCLVLISHPFPNLFERCFFAIHEYAHAVDFGGNVGNAHKGSQ